MKNNLIKIGLIASLVGSPIIYGLFNQENQKPEVKSQLIENLEKRQFIKENFIKNYDPFVDWLDSPYEAQVDSIIKEDNNSFYL